MNTNLKNLVSASVFAISVIAGLSGCISQAATVPPPDAGMMTPVVDSQSTGHTNGTDNAALSSGFAR